MSYTETAAERTDVRRFLYLNITTGMFWCLAILLAVVLQAPVWTQLTVLAVGLGVVNYQCLVTLQGDGADDRARPASTGSSNRCTPHRHHRHEPLGSSESTGSSNRYGRTAIIAMNLMVIALVAYSLMRSGRL